MTYTYLADKPLPAVVPYYGGKSQRIGRTFAGLLPEHEIYVEPFGGAAGLLMCKRPSKVEIYNDLNDGMVTLFRVVRDTDMCQQLIAQLELTPYARAEWSCCLGVYRTPEQWQTCSQVEKARIVYTLLQQGFTGTLVDGGWSFGGVKYSGSTSVSKSFYNSIARIPNITKRMQQVQIECQPAAKIIERWDSPATLFYLDPPYVISTRNPGTKTGHTKNHYSHEMADTQHQELIEQILGLKGMCLISGYESDIYLQLEQAGWRRKQFASFATSAMQSIGNGLKGKPRSGIARTECLWISPAAQQKRTLWDLEETLGATV